MQDSDSQYNAIETVSKKALWLLLDCQFISNNCQFSCTQFNHLPKERFGFICSVPRAFNGNVIFKCCARCHKAGNRSRNMKGLSVKRETLSHSITLFSKHGVRSSVIMLCRPYRCAQCFDTKRDFQHHKIRFIFTSDKCRKGKETEFLRRPPLGAQSRASSFLNSIESFAILPSGRAGRYVCSSFASANIVPTCPARECTQAHNVGA